MPTVSKWVGDCLNESSEIALSLFGCRSNNWQLRKIARRRPSEEAQTGEWLSISMAVRGRV